MSLSWEPIKDGERYCAPACGRGCTQEEHDAAERAAGALAIHLGDGWTGDVWENLGWHYRAISACGRIKVHGYPHHLGDGFTAFLGEAGCAGGRWAEHGETPQVAVAAAIAQGRRELKGLTKLLEGLVSPGDRLEEYARGHSDGTADRRLGIRKFVPSFPEIRAYARGYWNGVRGLPNVKE